MALTDPKDTLAYHNSRVLTSHRDMRETPLATTIAAVNKFLATDSEPGTKPEAEALFFYGMNHGVALIQSRFAPLEPLPAWECGFLNAYHAILGPKAVRAFYYLLLICTREARHNQSLTADTPVMHEKFGAATCQFFTSIEGGEHTIYQKLLDTPPATTLGNFCEALRWQFYNSKWNGGYGGKAWGKVADCLCRFVSGEFSAEMMLDTIWTLCHNNGPIFNKGICYGHHTHFLIRVLDVQRSGQIPEAVLSDAVLDGFTMGNSIKSIMLDLSKKFPDDIKSFVDWHAVEALGSVNKYPNDKAKQDKAGLTTPAMAAAHKKALEEAIKKAEELAKSQFEVMPGLTLTKIFRAA